MLDICFSIDEETGEHCTNEVHASRLCMKHYQQRRRAQVQLLNPMDWAAAAGGGVYVIEFGGYIKIGYAASFRDRLRNLPWETILILDPHGTYTTEAELHQRFAEDRLTLPNGMREWYERSDALDAWITDMRASELGEASQFGSEPTAVCSYEDCSSFIHAKGLCRQHYDLERSGIQLVTDEELNSVEF